MSGITSRVLQDISLSLPQKAIQLSSSRLHSTPSSRRFWSFFEFSRKENVAADLHRIPLSTSAVSPTVFAPRKARNASEPAVSSATPSMPSAVSLSGKRGCFSFAEKIPRKSALEPLDFMSLLDDNVSSVKWKLQSYKRLRHENAGDFAFLPNPVKSAPEGRHLVRIKSPNQIKQEMSLFGSWAQKPKSLVRSQTVTKFDLTKSPDKLRNRNYERDSGKSTLGKSESYLTPIKSAPSRPSRLPIPIEKASPPEIHQQLSDPTPIPNPPISYQCPKRGALAAELPTALRLQPHPRGSAASPSGTVGFGQPLAGNSGDGGSRKPPAFPRPPITSSEHLSLTQGNGDPWQKKSLAISVSGAASYSTNKSCGRGGKEDHAKPAKKPKQKEECKRYCCPAMNDEFECDIADCSKSNEDNDCYRPPAKRSSCSPPKKESCGSRSSYNPPPPPSTKKSSSCRSPSPTPNDCPTQSGHTGDYTYKVCCQNDCRDRLRNYQVCCSDERTTKRKPSKRSESKCPPQPLEGQEICTKPPADDCRPTKCPEPKNRGGNQRRRYSQLASLQGTSSSTGGTRDFSTLSSVHSTSRARRLAPERVLERSFASDPCKPKKEDPCKPKKEDPCKPKKEDPCKPKKADPCKPVEKPKKVDPCKPTEKPKKKLKLCKPPERPKEDPCKPVAKKQPVACKPVFCDTKKSKPSPKCLPVDQVSVLTKKPVNSCSPGESPKKSKSDEFCIEKGSNSKGGESVRERAEREKKEAEDCRTKKKNDPKKDPCKPFTSLEPKKQGDGLERVVSPCKQKQLSKKPKENSGCSILALAPALLSLPSHYLNIEHLFLTNPHPALLSTMRQTPLELSRDQTQDMNGPPSFIDNIFNDEEVEEAPVPIPIETEEEDE